MFVTTPRFGCIPETNSVIRIASPIVVISYFYWKPTFYIHARCMSPLLFLHTAGLDPEAENRTYICSIHYTMIRGEFVLFFNPEIISVGISFRRIFNCMLHPISHGILFDTSEHSESMPSNEKDHFVS